MKSKIGVILGACKVPKDLSAIYGEMPSHLIPINRKPASFFIINNMIKLGINKIYLSVSFKKDKVRKILSSLFDDKVMLIFVDSDCKKRPGFSLIKILSLIAKKEPDSNVVVNLADSLFEIPDELDWNSNFVFTSSDFFDSSKWCVVDTKKDSDAIVTYHEKKPNMESKNALAGFYVFKSSKLFNKITFNKKNVEISDILKKYSDCSEPFLSKSINGWYDLGHLDKYYLAKRKLLSSRYFNAFEFDNFLGTITKISSKSQKLKDEYAWYINIPKNISPLAPRVFDFKEERNKVELEMEYYGYPCLAEIWLYGEVSYHVWKYILKKLIFITDSFKKNSADVHESDYKKMYLDKTLDRIEEAKKIKPFNHLFESEMIVINGKAFLGWPNLKKFVEEYYKILFDPKDNCFIHGDLCFSNILFDMGSGIVRLIDPRGEWGHKKNIGDIKYDLAKLRHSLSGNYDFIVNDLFNLSLKGNIIRINMGLKTEEHYLVCELFDNMVKQSYDINKIIFIEGLLFLSMIPLHRDSKKRQLAMFSQGIKDLNEAFRDSK